MPHSGGEVSSVCVRLCLVRCWLFALVGVVVVVVVDTGEEEVDSICGG